MESKTISHEYTELLLIIKDQQEKIQLLLKDMSDLKGMIQTDRFLTTNEVAKKMKYTCTSSVTRLLNEGKLPYVKRGKIYLVKESEVDAFIDKNTSKAFNDNKHYMRPTRSNRSAA